MMDGSIPYARRLRVRVRGHVRAVGFRPFVKVVARRLALAGWVRADDDGVLIEVEGVMTERFLDELRRFAPPLARVDAVEVEELAADGAIKGFGIVETSLPRSADA